MEKKTEQRIRKFVKDRDWDQFHNGKDLALSLSLEASELLEIYQWSAADLECRDRLPEIKEELADVLIYAIQIAQHYHLSLDSIINAKITQNEKKYPVAKAKDCKLKYDKLK